MNTTKLEELKSVGKLYRFEVTNPKLKKQGIENQWFLTNKNNDRLYAGHINQEGKWSICKEKDLTPTQNYHSQEEMFGLLTENTIGRTGENARENIDESPEDNDRLIELEKKEKKTTSVNTGSIRFVPLEQNSYSQMDEDELITTQKEQEKKLKEQKELLELESRVREEEVLFTETIVVNENERQQLESSLIELITNEEKEFQNWSETQLAKQWRIDRVENMGEIRLIDRKDNHTIVSFDGESNSIIEKLSATDAENIIEELKSEVLSLETRERIESKKQQDEGLEID